ncbi:SHOCT domain-containing protein [Haloplanus halophilus]|uniref:SHOCT domain-containing protein n=1 Tax=Haloplanus halophilus TaxID=2949993 RepID=UPI0020414D55|nr:SHOCT domain-containing protein [Haloplanus sp. GDY1]
MRAPDADPDADADTDPLVAIASLVVLGLGFVAMALDVSAFWMVWVVGFAVVVPIVSILRGTDESRSPDRSTVDRDDDSVDAALATLRERYARGDLSDEAFEAKLDALLETETPEAARRRPSRTPPRERSATAEEEVADET